MRIPEYNIIQKLLEVNANLPVVCTNVFIAPSECPGPGPYPSKHLLMNGAYHFFRKKVMYGPPFCDGP
jgi:hypothetical protein